MATDFADKPTVIIFRVEGVPYVYSMMMSFPRIRYPVCMTVRWPPPQCLRWWIRKIFLPCVHVIVVVSKDTLWSEQSWRFSLQYWWLLEKLWTRCSWMLVEKAWSLLGTCYYKWICLLLWFMLLYVGREGDVWSHSQPGSEWYILVK
jgi:hypothetical protein